MVGWADYDSASYEGAGTVFAVLTLAAICLPVITVIIGAVKGRTGLGCLLAFLCAPLGLLILPFLSNKRRFPMPVETIRQSPAPPPRPSPQPGTAAITQSGNVDLEELRRRMKGQ